MSRVVVNAVLDSGLPSDEKFILSIMADWADDEGRNVYPSVERVAWKATKSVRRTRSTIARLREKGVLVPMGPTTGGRARSTRYRIALEALPVREPFVPARLRNGDDPSGFADDVDEALEALDRVPIPLRPGGVGDGLRGGEGAPESHIETRTIQTQNPDDMNLKPGRSEHETRTLASADPSGDPDRSVRGSNSLRAQAIIAAGEPARLRKVALATLREECTAQPMTYADNDYLNDAADDLEDGDVERIREEMGDARSWPLAKSIIGRAVAARRRGDDPWVRAATRRRAPSPASGRVGEGRPRGAPATDRRPREVDDLPPGAVRG